MTVSRCAHFRFVAPKATATAWLSCMLCGLMLIGGCRLCADCDEDAYPSYGGIWQRTHRDSGRVGSIFDPGGNRVSDLSEQAQSDGPNITNHAGSSADGGQGSAGPNQGQERDIMDTDGLEPPQPERPDDLQDLEKRYRDLQLEEINHRRPPVNAGQWQ